MKLVLWLMLPCGVVVGKLGTSTVSTIELAEAVHGSKDTDYGVISEDALIEAVKKRKRVAKKW